MEYVVTNLFWMSFNVLLALVPVLLVVFLRVKMPRPIYLFFFFLWLIFLPNTIYLITDLQHLPPQLFRTSMLFQTILIIQYVLLCSIGVVTYAFSLEPFSKLFKKFKLNQFSKDILYVGLNFVVAFGVILGKFERTHSWYIFTEPGRVLLDIHTTLTSDKHIWWAVIFGVVINVLFFAFRKYFPPLRADIQKRAR